MATLRCVLLASILVLQCITSIQAASNAELLEIVHASAPFELHEPSPADAWVKHGNLARAVNVDLFSAVYLPINVNVFVLGLDGHGNLGVKLPYRQLREWLEHLDHTIPHRSVDTTTVFHAQSTSFSPASHVSYHSHRPPNAANIQYRYLFRLIETHPSVLSVVERHMFSNHRRVEEDQLGSNEPKDQGRPELQLDPDHMALLLDDLATYLLKDRAVEEDEPADTATPPSGSKKKTTRPKVSLHKGYNIFLMNPRSNWSVDPKLYDASRLHFRYTRYGYRAGLSNTEIDTWIREMRTPGSIPDATGSVAPDGSHPPAAPEFPPVPEIPKDVQEDNTIDTTLHIPEDDHEEYDWNDFDDRDGLKADDLTADMGTEGEADEDDLEDRAFMDRLDKLESKLSEDKDGALEGLSEKELEELGLHPDDLKHGSTLESDVAGDTLPDDPVGAVDSEEDPYLDDTANRAAGGDEDDLTATQDDQQEVQAQDDDTAADGANTDGSPASRRLLQADAVPAASRKTFTASAMTPRYKTQSSMKQPQHSKGSAEAEDDDDAASVEEETPDDSDSQHTAGSPHSHPHAPTSTKKKAKVDRADLEHLAAMELSKEWADEVGSKHFPRGPASTKSYRDQLERQPWGSKYLSWLQGNVFAQEDCLTSNWIGPERSLFIDFTAGPFSWGPVVGGEGVVTQHSLPDIGTFASIHASTKYKESVQSKQINMSASALELPPPPPMDDLYHDAGMLDLDPQQMATAGDGTAAGESTASMVDVHYDWETVEAERLVNEDFLQKHCRSDHYETPQLKEQCESIREKQREIDHFISTQRPGLKGTKGSISFEGRHAFSFFNDGINKGHRFSLEADHFLSHLSSSLSETLHHVLTPSVADHAGLYAQRVNFQIYILSNQASYSPLAVEGGLIKTLKAALDGLRLEGQEFVYIAHKLSMADDPTLATAFANALKTAVVPTLRLNGEFTAVKRLYIDSGTIRNELMQIQHDRVRKAAKKKAAQASKASTSSNSKHSSHSAQGKTATHTTEDHTTFTMPNARDIPIFIFSVDYPLPLFVDRFYQSKALDHMIVAAQSSQHLWESHLQCNYQPIYWNLRSPVRSIITSVASVLGGLLPMHLSHDTAHNRTSQNWLWSVGSSPLAYTSHGLHFSRIHADVLHRNYIVTAISQVTSVINTAVLKLQRQPTTISNEIFRLLDLLELSHPELRKRRRTAAERKAEELRQPRLRHIRATYRLVRRQLANIYEDVEEFDFPKALARIKPMLATANRFSTLVDALVVQASQYECSSDPSLQHLGSNTYLLAGIVCLIFVLIRMLYTAKTKPKMN